MVLRTIDSLRVATLGGVLSSGAALLLVAVPGSSATTPTAASYAGTQTHSVSSGSAPTARVSPATKKEITLEAEVLKLTNAARKHARSCGSKYMKAAKPLRYNERLATAAGVHSRDMATHNYFSHTDRAGNAPWGRFTKAGYNWQAAAENIAAGQKSAREVVNDWIKSPGHCRNLMDRGLHELGVGYVEGPGIYHTYWTQDFGTR